MSQKFTANVTVVFEAESYSAAQSLITAALGVEPTADIQKIDLYRWAVQNVTPPPSPSPSPDFVVDSPEKANLAGMAAARLSLAATAFLTDGSGETVQNRGVRYLVERVTDPRFGHGWKATIEASDGFPVNQLAMRAQRAGGIDVTIPFEAIDGKFVASLVPAVMTPDARDWDFHIWVEGISVDTWTLPADTDSARRVAYRMTAPDGAPIAGGGTAI